MDTDEELAAIVALLGGQEPLSTFFSSFEHDFSLGPFKSHHDLHLLAQRGLPSVRYAFFLKVLGMPESQVLLPLKLPVRGVRNRRKALRLLGQVESERILRLVQAVCLARQACGNLQLALRWLSKPNEELRGASPFALLDTSFGAQLVENWLRVRLRQRAEFEARVNG